MFTRLNLPNTENRTPHTAFELPDMLAQLQSLIDQVPLGKVTTYGALATALGDVIASRWVAHALLRDPKTFAWPSHRVVRADGSLGLYAHGDADTKAARLAADGVAVQQGKVDLASHAADVQGEALPLAALRDEQATARERIRLAPLAKPPRFIAGLDVSYVDEQRGVGGYALVDAQTRELVWSTTIDCEAPFPYISSYLTFRELPVLARLLETAAAADRLADVYLIDGAGMMHPRGIGVASHFGVVANVPTIGVAKTHLYGSFDDRDVPAREARPIHSDEALMGWAIRPRSTSSKLIYVSPGHLVDLSAARHWALQMLGAHRLPEPIYWADRLSRKQAQRPG